MQVLGGQDLRDRPLDHPGGTGVAGFGGVFPHVAGQQAFGPELGRPSDRRGLLAGQTDDPRTGFGANLHGTARPGQILQRLQHPIGQRFLHGATNDVRGETVAMDEAGNAGPRGVLPQDPRARGPLHGLLAGLGDPLEGGLFLGGQDQGGACSTPWRC